MISKENVLFVGFYIKMHDKKSIGVLTIYQRIFDEILIKFFIKAL